MLHYRVFPAVVSGTLDSGAGIFILDPVLNVQLTPVVTANRHFHVTAFSLRYFPKYSIGMFCFENDEGKKQTWINVVLKLHLVDREEL